MTNYHINSDVQEALLVKYQYCTKVLKFHSLMGVYEEFFKLFDYVTENFLPAETLIESLGVNCSSLKMLHEVSFALENCKGNNKRNAILLS